jgi:hypothetical protein
MTAAGAPVPLCDVLLWKCSFETVGKDGFGRGYGNPHLSESDVIRLRPGVRAHLQVVGRLIGATN